jgi:magnesium transporter
MYVVDSDERLKGVLSLRDLIVAKPSTPISAITIDKVITVGLETGSGDVAEVIRKYNLLAVPVVDDDGHLEGIVTVDDVMDTMLSGKMKRRMARTFG